MEVLKYIGAAYILWLAIHIAFSKPSTENAEQSASFLKAEHPALMKDVSHARITFWWNRAVDIIPTDGGKGRGIEKMLEYYHFDKSQAMAFGDGNNDIEMLKSVGHGVAMANASDELKAIADDVCGDVAEDGIYYYCLEHGMI